jgi:hypothetical protein
MGSRDLRRSARVSTTLVTRWHRRSGDVIGVVRDINADGLFLCTEVTAEQGALIQLVIELPEQPPLAVLGIARFVGRTHLGVGIGVELFTLSNLGRQPWVAYYRCLLRERGLEDDAADDPSEAPASPAVGRSA